ncbi:MAG: DUF6755 family protein [Bryobacteraceae bacterium]
MNPQRGSLTAINGALALLILLLIIQIWLLFAALETHLAGHMEGALPAAVISGILFLCSLGLYLFVKHLDADAGQGR